MPAANPKRSGGGSFIDIAHDLMRSVPLIIKTACLNIRQDGGLLKTLMILASFSKMVFLQSMIVHNHFARKD